VDVKQQVSAVLTALTAAALVAGCSDDPAAGIATATVGRATVTEVVDAPGTVTAKATATVTAPAQGSLAELYVRNGQRVEAGTPLARIDSPQAQQRLTSARQAVATAGSGDLDLPAADLSATSRSADAAAAEGYAAARAAAARIPDPALRAAVLAQISTAEQRYAAARAQADAAITAVNEGVGTLAAALRSLTAAQRAAAAAALTAAQSTVDSLRLVAPVAGTVQLGSGTGGSGGDLGGLVDSLPPQVQDSAAQALGGAAAGGSSAPEPTTELQVGSPVTSGGVVVLLVDTSTLGLSVEVDETDVALVRPGVRARVELDAFPDAAYAGTVTAVDLTPTTSNRGGVSYRVRLSLTPSAAGGESGARPPAPRPGMSAVANLAVRTEPDAVAVPAAAVVRAGSRDAVWVVREGTARRQPVVLGASGEDLVAVASGLRTGEQVVVRGADRVRAGQSLPS